MLAFPSALKTYLALEPVDMRKQFNGLWALAAEHLKVDPFQGALFVFTNKDRDRVKLLYRDGGLGRGEALGIVHAVSFFLVTALLRMDAFAGIKQCSQ